MTSCRSKKQVSCPSFDVEKKEDKKEKKGPKYKRVILKDGKKINGKKQKKIKKQTS